MVSKWFLNGYCVPFLFRATPSPSEFRAETPKEWRYTQKRINFPQHNHLVHTHAGPCWSMPLLFAIPGAGLAPSTNKTAQTRTSCRDLWFGPAAQPASGYAITINDNKRARKITKNEITLALGFSLVVCVMFIVSLLPLPSLPPVLPVVCHFGLPKP